jgi:general stress protein 26
LDDGQIRSRPMAAYVRPEENAVWFLTDADSAKEQDVVAHPQVNLAFADAGAQTYVSVSGQAAIADDREKIRELFSTPAKAWWQSADDPSIRVLRVTPTEAEYWDSPGTLRAYIRMAAAAVSDTPPAMGDHEKVALEAAASD